MKTNETTKNIIVFLLCAILLLIIINYAYIKTVSENREVYKKEIVYGKHIAMYDHISYLFMGDSHVASDVNPAFIDNKSFNYAIPSENYVQSYYKLRKVVEKDGVAIDVLVLGIDEHSLAVAMENNGAMLQDLQYYYDHMSYQELQNVTGKKLLPLMINVNIPVVAHGIDWIELVYTLIKGPKLLKPSSQGYLSYDNKFSDDGDYRAKTHLDKQERISPLLLEHLNKTLELAAKHNISVVLIKYPVYHSYFDATKKYAIINSSEYYLEMQQRLEFKKRGICVLDYQKLFYNNTEYFKDSDHLNTHGAEEFTKILSKDLALCMNSK
jgi:hypothetical protein